MHACVVSCFSRVQLFETLWTAAHQAPLSVGILQARILEWIAMPSSRGSSKDQTQVSCMAGEFFKSEPPGKPRICLISPLMHLSHGLFRSWFPSDASESFLASYFAVLLVY